ncbi:MAG: adenylosuccinate synthetase [Candidatus Parabeggiatoa sp.]|nr:adenylosuccinate synthetase [Candidatus Parabeggiatoa sp.]
MELIIASGAQWGDEGKGKVSYYLSQFSDVCMRAGGGSNAEATFYHEGKGYHFQMIPSGVVRGKVGMMGDGVLISCDRLMLELRQLEEEFGDISDRFMISGNAHVVLPSHRAKDAFLDQNVLKINTIRQGIGPAMADRAYRVGVNVDTFIRTGGAPEGHDEHWEEREQYVEMLSKYRKNTKRYLAELKKTDKTVLIQGSQAFMLDNVHGTYPYVTSSYTSTAGLLQGAGLPYNTVTRNIGIVKAYPIRFDRTGHLPTECAESDQEVIRNAGNEFAHTSGTPLRIGWLDMVALRYAQDINHYTEFFFTKIDVLSELKEIPVCIGYRYHGKTIDTCYEWSNMDLSEYEPVYKVLKGWQRPIRGIQDFMELPVEARDYVAFLEDQVGVRVSLIGTGPKDDEVIVR